MNWDDIRIFLALARTGHLKESARRVGLNSTTVSRRIARLAESIGESLFDQYSGGYSLTARGAQLLEEAEKIEAVMLAIREDKKPQALAGRVRVSAPEGFGLFIAAHIADFHFRYPGVEVDLAVSSAGRLNPSKREADIAIGVRRPIRGLVAVRKLFTAVTRLYGAKSYLERYGPIESIEELGNHSLVGYISDLVYTNELNYLGELGLDLEPSIRCSSILAQEELIAGGAGLGMLPQFRASAKPNLVALFPNELHVHRDLWLIVNQDARKLPRTRVFIDWIQELIDQNRTLLTGDMPEAVPLPYGGD